MRKLILLLSLSIVSYVCAEESIGKHEAKEWLNIIDSGRYIESWQKSDILFQQKLTLNKWQGALKSVRSPLGKVISRAELSRNLHSSLTGIPNGEYIIIQYKTEFANQKLSTEILTLRKSRGQWRPVGYFIR